MKEKKDPKIFLRHVLESIDRIENDLTGLSEVKFSKSLTIQDAVVRRLEIISEAVRNLPDPFRKKYPEIAWKKIAGMRDVLIHEYFGVDMELVWKIAKNDIPKLKKQIVILLKKIQA
ncbi:MAG TPA: hypothetical protein DIT25_01850 [Candidatus Moranbacteria bacterium]|nr:hypothetical protein [Candidatus Moranbacteria bacterium]